jgi:hypothetical protein
MGENIKVGIMAFVSVFTAFWVIVSVDAFVSWRFTPIGEWSEIGRLSVVVLIIPLSAAIFGFLVTLCARMGLIK